MRTLRGWFLIVSTVGLSVMSTTGLRAESDQSSPSGSDSIAPASTTSGSTSPESGAAAGKIVNPLALPSASSAPITSQNSPVPSAIPGPISLQSSALPQIPLAAAPSFLNQAAVPSPHMYPYMVAPVSYATPPNGVAAFQSASYPVPQPMGATGPESLIGEFPGSSGYPGPMGYPGPSGYPMPPGYPDPAASGEYFGGDGKSPYCPHCAGAGCGFCGGFGHGVLARFVDCFLPYAEGGRCAPRWYDIALDGMYIRREDVGERVDFATFTRLSLGGTIVLSTADLNYEERPGFRFNAALQLLPGYNLEFAYFGLFNWSSVATVSDPTANLFSVFSGFGENPINGFDETDQSQFQSLRSSSTIDNLEINWRKRQTGPNCRLQWSWMYGARYVYLMDDLEYFTLGRNVAGVPIGQSISELRVRNSLTGFQLGADLWTNIVPGVSVGTDFKGGVYGNYAKQNTSVVATSTGGVSPQPVSEEATNNDIAFVGEANLMFIYRTSPNWTIRAGYTFLYLDGVALGPENFNTTNPFGAARTAKPVDDNSNVFYHGGFAGLEWMW